MTNHLVSPVDALNHRQTRCIELLLLGHTINETADIAKVSENSIDKWLRQPKFKDALNTGKRNAFNTAAIKLSNAFILSVDTLVSLMQDEDASATCRVRCADLILQNAIRVAELNEMNDRLTSLEVTLYEQ